MDRADAPTPPDTGTETIVARATPADPVQAKVFMVLPLVMSVMFAFFPAGLVLYWVTNTILTIAQQWNINRRIEAAQPVRN